MESLCGHRRDLAGILRPSTVGAVQLILSAAAEAGESVQIQPISCGHNWGFGSNLPNRDDVFLLDLSKLNRIRSSEIVGHSVELEPGVTQGQLDDWLAIHNRTHYFNVTGAGTSTSVIGNALEKGIGYSGSRHLDLLDLEVVLPGGQLVHTSKHASLQHFGFGSCLGPSVTQLFCQSNFGVITAARIALFRRPQKMGAVICRVRNPAFFASLVSAISDLMAEGACYGVPHIFNRERIIMSFAPLVDQEGLASLVDSTASWTALLPIKGPCSVFNAAAEEVVARLKSFGEVEILSGEANSDGAKLNYLLQGRPSDFSLASVTYAAFAKPVEPKLPLERTGAGLIHVTPLVPLNGDTAQKAVELAVRSLRKSGYEKPQLSLNAISSRVAALVIPISFDRRSPVTTKRAKEAATALISDFANAGMLPYRLGLDQADSLPPMGDPWPELLEAIQEVFDPTHCMSSSRYEPLWKTRNCPTKIGALL